MLNVYNDSCCGGSGGVGPPGPPGANGLGLFQEIITLPEGAATRVPLTLANTTGSFKILAKSTAATGAVASFDCSNAQVATPGQSERVTNSPATNNVRLKMEWNAGLQPAIYHTPFIPGSVNLLSYYVTIMEKI